MGARYQGVVGGRERRKVITIVEASGRGADLTREEGVGSCVRGERGRWAGGNGAGGGGGGHRRRGWCGAAVRPAGLKVGMGTRGRE